MVSDKPFEYSFQDEHLQKPHSSEKKFQLLFYSFTLLAIVIACLGLFGLVTVLMESKTKEIGIRKVLGSSVASIVNLITKDFVLLALIALLIASPIAYYAADQWLNSFAYRVDIEWTTFVLVGVISLVIAFVTISFKSVRAALTNPVDSLKVE